MTNFGVRCHHSEGGVGNRFVLSEWERSLQRVVVSTRLLHSVHCSLKFAWERSFKGSPACGGFSQENSVGFASASATWVACKGVWESQPGHSGWTTFA